MASLSKRTRFEVFKRDGFTCAYCGRKPPVVTLQVDHILAKSRGGSFSRENLITACFDCNAGKSNVPLTAIPEVLREKRARLQEQQDQVRAYNRLLESIDRTTRKSIEEISAAYTSSFPGYELTDQFKNSSLRRFLAKLPKVELINAMIKASTRFRNRDDAIKYFCGICWSKIREQTPTNS